MWKRRKEAEGFPETEPSPLVPPTVHKPAPEPPPPPPAPEARIGKAVLIKGQIYSKEDMFLDGQIEGSIEMPANRLTIGRNGRVQANVVAREVEVQGSIQGDIEAREKITIRGNANVIGNLKSASISIEDGAYFKGSIDIVRPVPEKTPARPAATPTTASSTAESTPQPPQGPQANQRSGV